MGYSTNFKGQIKIDPPASAELIRDVNAFCEKRHGDSINVYKDHPGFYCNWKVSEDGTSILWNGSEKSYDMDTWLPILIEKFFVQNNHILNGTVIAQGEDVGDTWTILVKDNIVERVDGHIKDTQSCANVTVIDDLVPSNEIAQFLLHNCYALDMHYAKDRAIMAERFRSQYNITKMKQMISK